MTEEKLKQLIVIEGPTASGKTSLGVELAQRWNTVVLSADSRQFYKELAIGTAKPSVEEMEGVKHYFVDSHFLEDEVSSARFANEALAVLEKEFQVHDKILMVGGSGMFIDALCVGLDDIPKSKELREVITKEWEEKGLEPLLQELKKTDPEYFEQVDKENPMRIIRAIEVIRLTGEPFSKQRTRSEKDHFFEVKRFVIHHDREVLYQRINARVDLMIEAGLLNEAKSVENLKHLSALRTVGYTELFDYFEGKISLERAIDLIKQNTRRYAKRQLTWFRRHPEAVWIEYSSTKQMADEIFLDSRL